MELAKEIGVAILARKFFTLENLGFLDFLLFSFRAKEEKPHV
jgi:hypothetical protein